MNIRSLITPSQKAKIRSIQHFIYRLLNNSSKINTSKKFDIIKYKDSDVFCGYYDVSPFNSFDDILFIRRFPKREDVDICIRSTENESDIKIIANTYAWNWQQGCRLRWFPQSDDKIIFNIFEKGEYGARLIDKQGNHIRDFCCPIYDLSNDGHWGLTLNFERLGVMRPGYGYACQPYIPNDLREESIGIVNLETNIIEERISYFEIGSVLSRNTDFSNCYVNHLSFSPDNKKFLFFWIEIKNNYHQASLLVYDIERKEIIPLETNEKVSHYVWIDNDSILCTSYKNSATCRYYIYKIKTRAKEEYCPNSLREDGHPSIDSGCKILTDTYPDKNGFQYLYIVDSEKDSKEILFKVYMKPVANGETRTDLHPRFNNDHTKICFDANYNGNREIVIVNRI